MSTPSKTSSYYSSRFLLFALVLSIVIHVVFVFWSPLEPSSIQSGAPSRINVSMQSSEGVGEKSTINKAKKEVQKTSDKSLSKPIAQREAQVTQPKIKPLKLPEENRVEPKPLPQKIVSVAKTQSKNVIKQASTETVQKQAEQITPEETQVESMSEEIDVKENKLVANNVEEKTIQPVRYEIGSNDNPKPRYPQMAYKKGWQGEVILGVHVKPDGTIEHLTFVKSTDYGILNYEAYETVRTSWHFKPLKDKNSSSETVLIEVPIVFNIADR